MFVLSFPSIFCIGGLIHGADGITNVPGTGSDLLPSIGMGSSLDDYYPRVAIHGLMRILRDSALSSHHTMVVQALMFIFKGLQLNSVQFLKEVMPPLLQLVRTCENNLRDFAFQQLGILVSIVKQHIRPHLPELFSLIRDFWQPSLHVQIIALVEQIALALSDEFKPYLTELLHQMLAVLNGGDRTDRRQPTVRVLCAIEVH